MTGRARALVARLRACAAAFPGRLLERGGPLAGEPVEGRRELSERYLRELRELVDDEELGPAAAERIRGDLFEDGPAGPRLKLSVYRSYLERRTGASGPHIVGPARGERLSGR